MTGMVRKAFLLSSVGVVIAGAAWAGVPSSATSAKPLAIKLVGYTNPPGPSGTVNYVIRDANSIPIPDAEVVLDFTTCTDIRLSQFINGGTTSIDCINHRVFGRANGLGQLAITVAGGGNGNVVPATNCVCVAVTVNSTPFPNMPASTFDRDGVNGVGAGDLGLVIFDFVNYPNACRSDFDNTLVVGAGDLGILIGEFVSGASALSASPYCN